MARPKKQPPVDPTTDERPRRKTALVCDLLSRDNGASLNEITGATGWLPHTARAALTGLRKSGLAITKERVDGTTRYRSAVTA